ncbi:MAG: restriction endonuclease [Verrucomicrobiia bacterium]
MIVYTNTDAPGEVKIIQDAMSWNDAAEKILRAAGDELVYRELAKRIIAKNLVATSSANPEISLYTSLRQEITRREQRGEPQRFAFLGKGMFTLVEFGGGSLAKKTKSALEQVKGSRNEACEELYKKLTNTNQGGSFETMVADLLAKMGYQNVEVIGGRDDQGVDILCQKRDGMTRIKVAIQCKCKSLTNKIGPKDVSTLRDNISTYQCQQGILITTSELNEAAKAKAKEAGKDPIHYIEHGEILDLFAEHSVGLKSEALKYFQLDPSSYDFLK